LLRKDAHYEHPWRTAEIHWRHGIIGRLFELHPSLLQAESIEGRAMFFDIDLIEAQKIASEGPSFRIRLYANIQLAGLISQLWRI